MEKNAPRVRDMTQGNPIRLILGFAIPLFIGNIFQQFYSMVDTIGGGPLSGRRRHCVHRGHGIPVFTAHQFCQ